MLLRMSFSLLLPVMFFAFRYKLEDARILGRNPGFGAVLLSVLIGCPMSLILVAMHNLIVRFFVAKGIALTLPAFFYVSADTSIESRLLALASAFLIPVLLQELFFRGLLFSVWPHSAARPLKILLSGFLFAVFMQNPVDFIPLLLMGIVLAYIRQSTDHFLCPVLTQISMLLTYCIFSSLLPYLDYISASISNDSSLVSVYVSAAALVMSLLAFLPVLAQLRRISIEKTQIDLLQEKNEDDSTSIHGQFGWTFLLGIILFAVNWVQLLGM
jgi:membrane protease YdiL (CAAX protease family)